MKISFDTALITGSSRGFGRAIAVKLAQDGVKKIAVHYLTRKDEAEKTVTHPRDAGVPKVCSYGATRRMQSAAEQIVHEAAKKLGGCDIFVKSVIPQLDQIYEHTLAAEVPLAKWQLAFDTQARAFLVGARAAAIYMTRGGRILALSYRPGDKRAAGTHGSAWVRPRQHWRVPVGTSRLLLLATVSL